MSGAETAIRAADAVTSIPAVPGRTSTRIVKGAGALSLTALVNITSQVAFVPVALSTWGSEAYGEWLVLTGLITFLSFTDLGIQSFVTNCMCSSYVRNDRQALQRQLHSALRLQVPLTGAVFAAIAIAFFFFPVAALLGLHTVSHRTLLVTVLLLAGELLIGIPMGVIAGVYRATGYLARGAVTGAVRQLLIFIVSLVLLVLTANFAVIACGRFIVAVLVTTAILVDLRRLHPWLKVRPTSGSWAEGRRMVMPGLFFLAIPVLQYASIQGIITLLQRVHAGSNVSWFSTHRTIVNFAVMISGLLTNAAMPEFTALYALEKREALVRLHRAVQRVNLWQVSAALLGMLPFLGLIYPRWTAGRLNLDWSLMALLMVRTMAWAWWNSSLILLSALNRVRPVAVALAGSLGITLACAVLLIPKWGTYGAAAAWLIGDLLSAGWGIPWLASRYLGEQAWSELKSFWLTLLPVLLASCLGLVLWTRSSSGVFHFALALPVTLLFTAVILWRSTNATEREVVRQVVAKAVPASVYRLLVYRLVSSQLR
jgi:O-antigen/teichoic acid export membrane protein